MVDFAGCKVEYTALCDRLSPPSPNVIRLRCGKASRKPRQLIIDCVDRKEPLHVCEVKVYGEYRMPLILTLLVPIPLG